jgi:hypothetical protein
MMAEETQAEEQQKEIEMFVSHFNHVLYDVDIRRPSGGFIQDMKKTGDTTAEFTYGPTNKSIHLSLYEDKCKLTITTKRNGNVISTVEVDLYNPDSWLNLEKSFKSFMQDIQDDTTFGQEFPSKSCAENSWNSTDYRETCGCGEKASFRIPDVDGNTVTFLCAECFSRSEFRCALCGKNLQIQSGPSDLDRICYECMDKLIQEMVLRRPDVLKPIIAQVAGALYKEINKLHTASVVDSAVANVGH